MEEAIQKNQVLTDEQIRKKISRMAYEIYENNFEEKSLVLAGIDGQGYVLAQLLQQEIQIISSLNCIVVKLTVNKSAPESTDVTLDINIKDLTKKNIILVDDVLNTGRILTYGMRPFLSILVKKIEVAVLVNRSHALYPIRPTYTGYELSTTLDDHIEVVLKKKFAVYLH